MVPWGTKQVPCVLWDVSNLSFAFIPPNWDYSVATVRAALEVKQVFEQLAEAEKGGVTPEQRKKLEEQAAEKVTVSSAFITSIHHILQGLQALFKVRN